MAEYGLHTGERICPRRRNDSGSHSFAAGILQTVRQVEASQQRYYNLARERRVVRRTYMSLLLLLTMSVLFVTTWLALFLSKIVTRPLAALAEATQEISRGHLDYRVEVSAADEIGDLVRSFNRMAEDLEIEPASDRSFQP